MEQGLRKSGIDIIGDVPWATHFCQFYQTKQDLLDILVPYFKAGLGNNEFCMWITAEPLGAEEARKAMTKAVPGFSRYLKEGQIEILPHTEWYLKGSSFDSQRVLDGWVEKLEQALAKGYEGLRLTGNTFWLEKKDWKSFADYEAAVNSVIGRYNMLALCTYCVDRCSAAEIIDVIRNHEFALIKQGGNWELIESSVYKQAKDALKASEKRYRQLIENIQEGIWLTDNTGITTFVNRRMAESLGYSVDGMVGKPISLFVSPPEVTDSAEKLKRRASGVTESYERRLRCKDGSERWFLVSGSAIKDAEGKVTETISTLTDITERKQAEEALREREQFLQRLADLNPAIISISDLVSGREVYSSRPMLPLLGYKPEEIKDMDSFARSIVNPADLERATAATAEIRKVTDDRPRDIEIRIKAADGNWHCFQLIYVIFKRDSNGLPLQAMGITRDITERKQAEEALRETRDYLENLINYANAPIIVWDPQFRITRFNHAFERLTGLKADEVLGKQLDILFPGESRAESLDHIAEALAGERWETVEIPILRQDGTVRTVLWNSATLYGSDSKTAVATIAQGQDITERKQAEEALRETRDYLNNLLDYANAPIIVWDPQFRITRFNHAFERLTGLSSSEVLGRQLDILFPEDSRAESMEHIAEAVAGERWETVEIPILRQDGMVRTVLWNSATLYGADGKTGVATIAQGQDITERKQAEEEVKRLNESLQQRAAELEAANKELESFSYSVSHDLRAPLRSMDGFSQALLEDYPDKLDDEGRDYLKRIQDSAGYMAQLIDDMLELSRLARVSMRLETVNLSELAEAIAFELKKAQPERQGEFAIKPGLVAYGDARLLRVVMENLLDNAWKFSAKIPHAKIEVGTAEHDGREVYFVHDNGAGFDMLYADKLFVPFQRLHRATEFPGTGIGLATVKRLIHRHGGEVWADGEVGKGATFYFTLP